MINKINKLFQYDNPNIQIIIDELLQLNNQCKRIHEGLMHLSANYPFGKNNLEFLTEDVPKLNKLKQNLQPMLNQSQTLFSQKSNTSLNMRRM